MVVENPIQIVIAANVDASSILVQHEYCAAARCNTGRAIWLYTALRHHRLRAEMGAAIVNIDRMSRVQLHEAPDLPAPEGMAYKALFTFEKGQLVGHAELVGVPVVKPSPAIRKLWQVVREEVVRCGVRCKANG